MQPAYAGSADTFHYPNGAGYSTLTMNPMVQKVQLALQKQGYNVGNTEGQYDPDTRAAVNRFERDNGMPQTGTITMPVLQALGLN